VSPVEAIIIYLSIGAPFGVLVLFSQRTSKTASVVYASLATAGWPILGTYRLYRSLTRAGSSSRAGAGSVVESQDDLIDLLERLSKQVPTEQAELFAIAGHPNPWMATNCYARARKKVIDSHLDRLATDDFESRSVPHLGDEPLNREVERQAVTSLVT